MNPPTYRYALADAKTQLWVAAFMLGAVLAVIAKAALRVDQADDAGGDVVFIFGMGSEPEAAALEARRRKAEAE